MTGMPGIGVRFWGASMVALALAPGPLRAELLFFEGFDYPAGRELGEPSSAGVWENDKDEIRIAPDNLEHPGLAAPTGNSLAFAPAEPNPDGVRTVPGAWREQYSGTLYVSFILRLESVAGISGEGEGSTLLTLGHPSNNSPLLAVNLRRDDTLRIGVVKYPSSGEVPSTSAFFTEGEGADLQSEGATEYLVVAKYEWVEGEANDKVALWVNPTTLGSGEDPERKVVSGEGPDGDKSAGRLTLCRGPHVRIDELRLGQSWAEVTPPSSASRPWWPLVATIAGLAVAGFWIAHLLGKVRERSAALMAQTHQREMAEQQRLMERERARIAHDLHDELGADITEIGMLATRARSESDGACLEQVGEKARHMVGKLEEIVWAMNPEHDSLGALVDYFSFFGDRFLGLANIRLVVEPSEGAADLRVEARRRHQLFLVFREALANVVRHAGASEVRLRVGVDERELRVEVEDDGCGLAIADPTAPGHEGIANMRRRIAKLGGQFEIAGEAGRGTRVRFSVPRES